MTSKLPALIRSFNKPGSKYHITDDGSKTRCRRRIESLTETHALALDETERCPRCGSAGDFEAINDIRIAEEKREKQERDEQFRRIDETRAARNTARPGLVDEIKLLINGINIEALNMSLGGEAAEALEIAEKHYENCDNLRIPVEYQGQTFTIKIEVWNGDHQ